jgi:hypothetical protein
MWEARVGRLLRGRHACVAALTVTIALALVPAGASAASPILEFVVPGDHLPVGFTVESGPVIAQMAGFKSVVHCNASHGKGEITGPRSTVSEYALTGCVTQRGLAEPCHSKGAASEEITTGPIDAELVYLDQAKHEVAMLLDPGGGRYIAFECGGESAEGYGPFLAPGGPVDREANVFTLTLSQSNSMQTPDEYEGAGGEKLAAIPTGRHGSEGLVTTGVEAAFTVHTSVPVYVRAVSSEEVVAAQQAEEAAAKKRQEEEAAATAKRHQEEEAAAKNRQEEQGLAAKAAGVHGGLQTATLAALTGAISRALAPSGAGAKIGALLAHGGLTQTFTAPEPGVLVIQWWLVPPGAHLAKRGKHAPVLVARGSAVFSSAATRKIKVSLTGAGRRLLASARQLKLTASVQFTPLAHLPIGATRIVRLKR